MPRRSVVRPLTRFLALFGALPLRAGAPTCGGLGVVVAAGMFAPLVGACDSDDGTPAVSETTADDSSRVTRDAAPSLAFDSATDGESNHDAGGTGSTTPTVSDADSPEAGLGLAPIGLTDASQDAAGVHLPQQPAQRAGSSLGQFTLTLQPELDGNAAYATLQGKVWSNPVPQREGWETTLQDGHCLVREPLQPRCASDCTSPEFCALGDVCAAEPPTVDVGAVTVRGLLNVGMTDSFVMSPLNPTTNQYIASGDARLVYPPLQDGSNFTIEAAGGALEAFIIGTQGITPLSLTVKDELPIETGLPLQLSWDPGDTPAARVLVNVDISHHGGTKGEIVCDLEDTGSLEISEELVTKLIDLGFAGFPEVQVERYTSGFANVGNNHVELRVVSYVKQLLSIPGLVSCVDATECADDELCVASMCVASQETN